MLLEHKIGRLSNEVVAELKSGLAFALDLKSATAKHE